MNYIYRITNTINGKIYIGKTKDPIQRKISHFAAGELKFKRPREKQLYAAMHNHGIENFIFEVIDSTEDDINALEHKWIVETNAAKLGYNMTLGGEGGDTFTYLDAEKKANRRASHSIGSKLMWQNQNYADKIRSSITEKWKDESYRESVIAGIKHKYDNPLYRKEFSDKMKELFNRPENREKRSLNSRGVKNSQWQGYVKTIDVVGNVAFYDTSLEAAKILKMSSAGIRNHCKNHTSPKTGIYKGWKFELTKEKL